MSTRRWKGLTLGIHVGRERGVGSGDDQQPAGSQDPPRFLEQQRRLLDVLDDLERNEGIEHEAPNGSLAASPTTKRTLPARVRSLRVRDGLIVEVDSDDPCGYGSEPSRPIALPAPDVRAR